MEVINEVLWLTQTGVRARLEREGVVEVLVARFSPLEMEEACHVLRGWLGNRVDLEEVVQTIPFTTPSRAEDIPCPYDSAVAKSSYCSAPCRRYDLMETARVGTSEGRLRMETPDVKLVLLETTGQVCWPLCKTPSCNTTYDFSISTKPRKLCKVERLAGSRAETSRQFTRWPDECCSKLDHNKNIKEEPEKCKANGQANTGTPQNETEHAARVAKALKVWRLVTRTIKTTTTNTIITLKHLNTAAVSTMTYTTLGPCYKMSTRVSRNISRNPRRLSIHHLPPHTPPPNTLLLSTLPHNTPLLSTLPHNTPLLSTLPHSTPLCSIRLH
ncbi:hypothetical protein Pcinc_018671 [Petrolisthes cinctipes]|uniref:Uncharacterized protein n=1 Tax=Petrolisthes cinctipes TaxID=88211 RepID=A0AAE1FRK8_PETCI|nr:hypothetical protein Pcinc_018671 [Petrolisthes cinctipes]